MAVVKLSDKSIEEGYQPFDPDGPYYSQIQDGLEFIKSKEIDYGFGKGYTQVGNQHHENYNTAWALMAFVATRDASYQSFAQGAADYFSNSQADNGGWGYHAGDNDRWQDNSNTGYVTLALVAARNFGCDVPEDVINKHETWVDLIQDDASGGSIYSPQYSNPWINTLKTGNLLFEMAFVGDKENTPRVQDAVTYIQNTWNASGGSTSQPGWKPNNFQAMYTMMKGFTALGIDEINVGGPMDWYAEFAEAINASKIGGPGMYYWPPAAWTDNYLSTVFALLTLEKIVELPRIEVYLDIKPTSCPNPFNMGANGVLPVAILGTADCDVYNIDVSTLTLAGVAPIESMTNYEDVSAPLYDPSEACECTTEGPDGYMDLTLKFERQAIAAALGEVNDGDIIPLTVTGESHEGLEISGIDCIVIKKKGKK